MESRGEHTRRGILSMLAAGLRGFMRSSPARYGWIGVCRVCGESSKPAPRRSGFFFVVVVCLVCDGSEEVVEDDESVCERRSVRVGRESPGRTKVEVVIV